MPPLSGLRSFALPLDPSSIVESGYRGFDRAQQEQENQIRLALQRLALQEEQRKAAELSRTPQTVTLSSPGIPGIAAGPNAAPLGGGQLTSLEEAPQGITLGVPGATETITEYPRYETPPNFEQRRRQAQARLDMDQAFKEADDRFRAGDEEGYWAARARAYGHGADWVDPQSRGAAFEHRNKALDQLASRRRFGRNQDFESAGAAMERFNKNPSDPAALTNIWITAAKIRDPHAQELLDRWLPQAEKEYMERQAATPERQAFGVIMRALNEKREARLKQGITLTPEVLQEIGLEIQREHPQEAERFDYLLFTGKGQIPLQFAKMFHPEFTTDKDIEKWREIEAADFRHPDGTPYSMDEKLQVFSTMKGKGTPAEQMSRIQYNQARAQNQTTLAHSHQERSLGANGLRVETGHALEMELAGFNKQLADLPQQRYTDQERKEQERLLKGHIAEVHAELDERARLRRAAAGPTPPAPPTAGYGPREAALTDKAYKLWQDDRDPNKGRWEDPAVWKKYIERAARTP